MSDSVYVTATGITRAATRYQQVSCLSASTFHFKERLPNICLTPLVNVEHFVRLIISQ